MSGVASLWDQKLGLGQGQRGGCRGEEGLPRVPVEPASGLRGAPCSPALGTNRSVLAGTARVELCAQGSADLAHLDDGPYEAGGEKEQDPRLIPVPANSYFGRDPSLAQSCSNPLLLFLVLPLHAPILLSLSLSLSLTLSLSVFLSLILISLVSLSLSYSFSPSSSSTAFFLPLCLALSPHSVALPPSLVCPPTCPPQGCSL